MGFWSKLFGGTAPTPPPAVASVSSPGALDNVLRDPVTDLFNRQHLLYRLTALMAQSDRDRESLAVVLWDIDGFVDFNNQYGKSEGDIFLKKVADVIRTSLRPYDEAFRVGGDEFCALLRPAKEKLAEDVMQRVRKLVVDNVLSSNTEYKDRTFSISSGVVFYPGEHKLPEALLHAAEQALYKMRRSR